jgi:hypothetical protein
MMTLEIVPKEKQPIHAAWRGLAESPVHRKCTPGSGSGLRKRTSSPADTASQTDFTDRPPRYEWTSSPYTAANTGSS